MVSFIASRHSRAPWWSDEDWAAARKVQTETLPRYFLAKVDADLHLARLAKSRDGFQAINLRPGTLTDDAAGGKVLLGKTPARGKISREDVAVVAAELLGREDTQGWYDLVAGEDAVADAVEKLVKSGHDGMEGEEL